MNEEIDESEFYHQDFTTASEWEIFIARMEEVINQWKTEEIDENFSRHGIWDVKEEKIHFAEVEFNFLYYKKAEVSTRESQAAENSDVRHPMQGLYDFSLRNEKEAFADSVLADWYGLVDFMVLTPKNQGITSESRIKMLLSSVYIVSSNLSLETPIFVQIQEKWQQCYLGVYESNGVRTNFEMVHLRKGPQHCHYLTGLLDLFKSKIMAPVSIETVIVSLRTRYDLQHFGSFAWKQDLSVEGDGVDFAGFHLLPFGVGIDPVKVLQLRASWSHLPDHSVIDSESYSDFDPTKAQKWTLTAKMTDNALCYLADALNEFQDSCNNSCTVYDVLGDYATTTAPEANPLDLLTEPTVPTISTIINRAAVRNAAYGKSKVAPPIGENTLVNLLYFLFPDADEQMLHLYNLGEGNNVETGKNQSGFGKSFELEFKGCKTCVRDSLVWRLVVVLIHSLQSLGGIKAFAQIWYEFVQEMRYRWENAVTIPGIPNGFPDMRTSLLNQKLQMLNCCIERKRARENPKNIQPDSSDEDDEFFDCLEERQSILNQPVGRLGKFGDLKLLKTGEPLYIPITQEPVIKTEDQLEEDTDVLLKLGSDAEATELRARIMSASLLSDMESFKAANPGSIVEDFIRWYSPRDWIESEDQFDEWGQKMGQLSPRMMIEENNIWVQTWKSAKPVPASRQKRLFDDTKEAEKVLQFLDYREIGQICQLIVPIVAHTAIYRLVEECQQCSRELSDSISTKLATLVKQVEKISRDNVFPTKRRFDKFIQEVSEVELLVSQVNSLQYKLNPSGMQDEKMSAFIGGLVDEREMEVEDRTKSDIGARLIQMFSDQQKLSSTIIGATPPIEETKTASVFPVIPDEKEFVLRTEAVRPAIYSCKSIQFLRAIISKNDFRLAGAFSEDIVFF